LSPISFFTPGAGFIWSFEYVTHCQTLVVLCLEETEWSVVQAFVSVSG